MLSKPAHSFASNDVSVSDWLIVKFIFMTKFEFKSNKTDRGGGEDMECVDVEDNEQGRKHCLKILTTDINTEGEFSFGDLNVLFVMLICAHFVYVRRSSFCASLRLTFPYLCLSPKMSKMSIVRAN